MNIMFFCKSIHACAFLSHGEGLVDSSLGLVIKGQRQWRKGFAGSFSVILNTFQIQVMRICSKFGISVASDFTDRVWDQD